VSPTREEVRAKLRAAVRAQSPNPSPGATFVASEVGQRLCRGGGLKERRATVEVVEDPWQLVDLIRSRSMADITSALQLEPDAPRLVQTRPWPVALLPLCNLTPVASVNVPVVPEAFQVDIAGFAADGQNLPGLVGADTASFSVDYFETLRVGGLVPVPMSVLEDSSLAEATIDRLVTGSWRRAVENLAIAGNTAPSLVGIMNTTGVPLVDGSGLAPPDALADGVALVQGAGWYGPLCVVASPTTLKTIFTTKDDDHNYLRVRSALPAVGAWLPAPGVPDGSALVLDPSELVVFLYAAFTISITQAYEDFLARNMAAVKGEQRVAVWLRNPGAAVVVENL